MAMPEDRTSLPALCAQPEAGNAGEGAGATPGGRRAVDYRPRRLVAPPLPPAPPGGRLAAGDRDEIPFGRPGRRSCVAAHASTALRDHTRPMARCASGLGKSSYDSMS
jgi:hypothetical protein